MRRSGWWRGTRGEGLGRGSAGGEGMEEVRPGEEMGKAWKKMKWGLGRGKPCRGGSLGRRILAAFHVYALFGTFC